MHIFTSLKSKVAALFPSTDARYVSQAERESRAYANSDKIIVGTLAALCFSVFALNAAAISYAASEANPRVARVVAVAQTSAGYQVALTLATDADCAPGSHVAARFEDGTVAQLGCWMQPDPSTVSVRWMSLAKNGEVTYDARIYQKSAFEPLRKAASRVADISAANKGGV